MDVPLSSPLSHSGYLLLKALLRLAGLLCLVSVATFVLLSYSPIDPIKAYIGNDLLHVPPEQYARIAARWGLDQPLWLRYWHWFTQVLRGDLGYSMLYNAPVGEVIGQRFAASFLLLAGAWLLSGFFGILLGLCAGRYLNRWPDRLICRFAYLLASLP
ncbi:MAG: ABC transporter permease, partial [Aeromonas veronii]